ncbi:PDZ domain-containing protein [Amphibacillus sp. Q70]|uniref:PDZ domain-containing protein n=1 Tax=Amphibacillus sp. Q70 TaxID=3453416 RepID=UPI003F8433A0
MESWLLEIGKAIIRLLLNPLLYWFIIITILASLARIKRERNDFGRKIYPIFDELYGQRLRGILFGLLISIVMMVLGVGLHPILLLGVILFTILFTLNKKFTWLSSAYTFGFTTIVLLFFPYYRDMLPPLLRAELTQMDWVIFTTLMGAFLIIEGLMISSVARDQTFPELITSSRGKTAGQHRLKKLTLVPLIMFWPIGSLSIVSDWWPVIEWNEMPFGLIIFPVIIGFDFTVRSGIPTKVAKRYSEFPLLLGFLVIALSLMSYYIKIFSLVCILVAIIGREWLAYQMKTKDQNQPPIFSPLTTGLKILAVLPGTPAVDLGLMVGDTIVKVNGQAVSNPTEFYHALQINRAFCKLDVVDERGEVRFTQRAFYEGEHHELGVIFVENHQERMAE